MVGKRILVLASGFAALGLLWFPYAAFRDFDASIASQANCEDDGLGGWQLVLKSHAVNHAGKLPSVPQRATMASQYRLNRGNFVLRCNTRADYQWNPYVIRTTRARGVPLAWCGRPHGFQRKWRNVLFSDLSLGRWSEDEMQRWLQNRSPEKWKP